MSQQLINRSPDLKQLRDEGYDIEVRSGHLLVKSVPYVTPGKVVHRGTLVSPLDVNGDATGQPREHTAWFQGEHPCFADGRVMEPIKHSSPRKEIAKGVFVDHMFSAKPKGGRYRDYHQKMLTYVGHISGPARSLDPTATAQTSVVVVPEEEDYPFHYMDTASGKAGIGAITAKLEHKKIAIVGAGGTGSYVLDLIAKTPVIEIHLFDGDVFSNHNAFRSPGAPSVEELLEHPSKVGYLVGRYSKMHRRVIPHETFLDETNVHELQGMDFVFLCLDRGGDKRLVVDRMEQWGTPFIDVGIGVQDKDGELFGQVRVTASTVDKRDHVRNRISFSDRGEDDYSTNIQIAELNALNAALAVIKWKKLCGFYQDLEREHCSVYAISGNAVVNEDQA